MSNCSRVDLVCVQSIFFQAVSLWPLLRYSAQFRNLSAAQTCCLGPDRARQPASLCSQRAGHCITFMIPKLDGKGYKEIYILHESFQVIQMCNLSRHCAQGKYIFCPHKTDCFLISDSCGVLFLFVFVYVFPCLIFKQLSNSHRSKIQKHSHNEITLFNLRAPSTGPPPKVKPPNIIVTFLCILPQVAFYAYTNECEACILILTDFQEKTTRLRGTTIACQPRTFPVLALKVPSLGKFLIPGQIRMVGHSQSSIHCPAQMHFGDVFVSVPRSFSFFLLIDA